MRNPYKNYFQNKGTQNIGINDNINNTLKYKKQQNSI
jgi:hypothetical protein